MNKATIIIGPRESGKTSLAYALAEKKKTVEINFHEIGQNFQFHAVEKDTEVILIDDIKEKSQIIDIVTCQRIKVDKPGKSPYIIDRPELIITTENINFRGIDNYPWVHIIELTTPAEKSKKEALPELVLEAYDTIEKLLVDKEDQPLFKANSITSDCLLHTLNQLYKTDSSLDKLLK